MKLHGRKWRKPFRYDGIRRSPTPLRHSIWHLHRSPQRLLSAGAALLFALIAAAVMIGLAVSLSARSFGGLLASVFGGDSDRAKEAAELGAVRIQAALMQERNRGMLRVAPGGSVSWTSTQLNSGNNPCAINADRTFTADLANIAKGGASGTSTIDVSSGASAPVVYVSNTGTATVSDDSTPSSTPPSNTTHAYQLASITAPSLASWTNKSGSPLGSPTRGQLTLRVRGYSYNSGRLSGSALLEKTLEVLPKCCNLSLGGNNNTAIGNDNRNCNAQINNPSFGFFFNTDLDPDATKSLKFSGSKSALASDDTPVSPVLCRDSGTSKCPTVVDIGGTNTTIVSEPFPINPPDQYSDAKISPSNPQAANWSINVSTVKGTKTIKCGNNASTGSTNFFRSYSTTYNGTNVDVCEVNPANTSDLPSECGTKTNDTVTEIDLKGKPQPRTFTTIHCNLRSLSNASGQIWRFATSDTHRIKLHFPAETTTGKSGVQAISIKGFAQHCDYDTSTSTGCANTKAVSNPLLRLSLLGCPGSAADTGCIDNAAAGTAGSLTDNSKNSSNTQLITLSGNSSVTGRPYFLYFPIGDVTVNGSGGTDEPYSLGGVFWINTLAGNGNLKVSIPGSGIGDIMNQYSGSSGGGSDDESEEATSAPPILEYTLRAVQRYFFNLGS